MQFTGDSLRRNSLRTAWVELMVSLGMNANKKSCQSRMQTRLGHQCVKLVQAIFCIVRMLVKRTDQFEETKTILSLMISLFFLFNQKILENHENSRVTHVCKKLN